MACKLVIKDKHIQSVLGKSEFESLDDFQGVFYNKFVLNPSAIPVTSSKGITFLRLSQNEDQSISVTLRTNTELPIENYNLELPEDTVKINDYEAVIPPTINENGNPVADLDTFMYLWLGNYYYPDIDKLNKLFEKTIPEVLRSFATKLVYEQKDRLEKGEVIPNESRNFVESLIGEKGLVNYYASIIEAHYKSSPAQLEKLEEIKGEIAKFTKIIDQFSPIEEKPLEKKYANYTMISLGEDLSPEEAEIAKDLKETEEQPTAEKNTTVVKSFSKPTATFDSDTTDNAEVGKSILMNLVNNDSREFRAVMAIDDPSFVQNKIVVNNQITSLKVNQVNTKNPSVIIIEVKEGNEWKKVFLKKNTSGLVKTADLAKLDPFSLTTDPTEAYQFNYELEENNEVKSLKSPQLTLRSEQLSTLSKDPQKKAAIENLYNELKSKGLSIFHYILKGSKAITRNYLPLKVRGFSIEDITIKATGPYKGIPQINGEYIDTGVLPENVKQEVKDLLNFNYSSEREALEVVKYLNALIGVGDFTPIESADSVGTNRINITRRTIGFFPDVVNGKYVIKSVVYRYKDDGKFYYNSTKEKLDFLSYDGNSKTLIDKSLDAARLQLPKVPFKKGMQEPHEIVGEYPTKYVVREGALEIVEWSTEEQHNFILENSKTHLTKSGDTIANFDQILYVSGFTREAEQAPQVPTQPDSTDLSEKNAELNEIKTENALVGQSILKKAGYKNENRLPNGNVKGGQAGWKIRFNIKNPKTGNSYYADGKSTLVDEEYNKRAETLVNFLLEYFGSNQKADSKKLEKHYILEDKDGTKREPFKHLSGGEIGESDFTIYIGSADDVLKFISDIRTKHPEIIDLLHQGNQSGDVMIDNIFKGRIEGAKIGFSEYHVPSNLYKLVGSNEFSFVHKGDRIVVNYGNGNLSDIFVYNERTRKGYGGVFDKNMQKDQPELYKNIRNIIGFQLYGKYLTGSNNEFVKFTGVSQEDLSSLSNVTPTPQVSDKEGTLVDIKEISKKFTDIQKLFKSLFDKKAKDTIIVFKTLPNNRAYTEIKSDSSEYTQDELNERGIKVTLKKNQKINKIIYIDVNSFDAALTEDENQSALTSQAIVEEMIHALTYDKIATKEVLESEEYGRIVNAIKQLQDSVNLDSLTDEQKKYFDYYIGVKGEEITPAQVLEFLASTQIEVLKPIFESANIDYPKADYSSLYEYLESLFKSLKKFLADLLLKDSPSLQERITSDTISIILDKVTGAQTLQTLPLESIPTGEQPSTSATDKKTAISEGINKSGKDKVNFTEEQLSKLVDGITPDGNISVAALQRILKIGYNKALSISENINTELAGLSALPVEIKAGEEIDEVEKIIAEVGAQPETTPVSVDGETSATERGVEPAPISKGKVTSGLSRKFNKKSDTELYTLIESVKPKFSTSEKTELAFEDLAVRKSAANHLDMVAAEYLFFENSYTPFIFNQISLQDLIELGKDILQKELDDPETTKERKNFVQYFYNNIETIWIENSKLLSIIDRELREEYSPEAESDTTIDGELKIGQDASESESNGGDSSSKFEERTEQKKSVLETIGVYAQHFVRMIPRIKTIDGVPQYESFEEDGITFTSPEYLRDNYGNLVPADYTTTWNSIADIVKGSMTIEEMILVLESSFLKVPEVAIFLDRLKRIGATREDTLLLKNLEKSLQKVFIPTEVMVQQEAAEPGGVRNFSIFAQGRLDLINIQNILSSRFREKFANFIVGLEVDYVKLNAFLKENTGVQGTERFVSPDNYKQIVNFWANNGINIPAKLPENLRIKLEKNLAVFTFELIAKFNELEKYKISNAVADIKGFDLFSFVAKDTLLNGNKVRSNSLAKNAVLTSLADVLPYSTSNMTKNAEGENQSNLHNFSSFLTYIKYINNLYKNGAAFRDKIYGAIPRLKNPIAKYSWVLDKVRAGAKITPINLSGVQYTNKGTNTINLDLIPYLQFQMQSLLLNNTKENLRAETASTSFGFRIDNSKEKLPISKSVLQSMRPIFESYLRGEIERITKEKKSDYKYYSKYNNKKDKFTFLDGVLSDNLKGKIYEIINNNLDKSDEEIWSLVLPLRQEYVNDFTSYKAKIRENFENFIFEETGVVLSIEHPIFNNGSLKEHVNSIGFNDAIDMFLMNGVVLGIEEIILFHGEVGQFDKFYKRSKSTISNGTSVVVGQNLKKLLQTTLQGYTFSEIIGGQRPEYYSDPTQLKTSTFFDDIMPLSDKQRENLEKGTVNSLELSAKSFGKKFDKKEAEETAKKTVEQFDNANIGDGQGWIHPDAYRMVLMGVDSWSPEREEGFIYLAIKEKKRKGFPLEEKDVQKLKEVEDKIKTKGYYFQFPDIKFQYRGGGVLTISIDGKEEDVEAPTAIEVLDKFALAPLFPEFAQNSIAEKMLEHMTKNNIAYTKFESATKIGGFEKNNLNDLLSDDFEFKGVHKITTVFLKEQVKTPSKIKEQDSLGTQKRKLLISNLSIDGKFLDEMKPFYNMWKGNQKSLADKARKDLYEDLGIDPKFLENPNAKIDININKLVALLRKEVDKRDLPRPLRAFFEKDFGPKEMVFFEQSLSPKIVENMLYSMLKNRIVKAKFPGSQLIQISSSLFNRTTNVNEDGRDLEFYRYDELTGKILPAQCKMTLHGPFLNLLNLPEVKANGGNLEALNALLRDPEFRKKHKDVITVVSYRIPTQGYNSMDILEIVEFLPGYLGNTIIPPPQITVKSGTDFDYDKMPTIYPNIDKDGNYISSDNVDMEIHTLSKEEYKRRISELNSKIEAERTKLKDQNKQAFEEAQSILKTPGDVSVSDLSPKELQSLKVFKGNLYEEIEKFKNEVDELKESLKELKPYLDKTQPMSSRKKAYKEEFGKDMNLTELLEKRQKLQDSLKVRVEDISNRYTILNKLKNIKEEVNASLNTLVEERNKLKRSRKVEAVYVNGLIEAAKGILLHPMNFHRLITPNNVSIVTDKIQEILERIYGTKNVNPEPVNTDIFDYTTHLKKWLAVKIKDLLGITAVNNTFFALMQEANFSFNNTIDINDSSFDFKTPLLTKEERKEARVTNPFLADSGIEKLEILNQFINLFVDAASNDIAGYTNLIRDNVGFVILQNDLGVPFERTLALIHQPIIYRYNQIVKENTGKGLSKAQAEKIAISELLNVRTSVDGYPLKSSKVWAQIKKKYDEKIDLLDIDGLSNSVLTKDNISNFENNPTQQAALLYYIVGIKQADALREAQSNVNYDTSPIQSYKRSVVRENIIKRIEKTGFVSKWAMERIKSGVIGHLNIHNELKFLSEKLFPIKADPDFVDFSAPLFEKIPTNKLDEFITTFDNDFLMYIIQNFSINFNQERYEYIKSLMSNGSLMIRWNQLIAKYKLEETRLAQKLYPVTQGYSSANPAIFMGLDNDSEEFNAIEEEIRSYANPVGNSPREIELKAFANDLMDLGFFQTGYNTGRLYMLKVLPAEYTDQFKDAFVNFYNLTQEEKRREYAKFLGAFESQRFDGIAAPLIAPEDQMMMATYFGTTSDVLINYLEDTSIAQQKGYNSSTTPKRGLTALTEVIAPIETISRLGTSTTFTIFDNTVKKEVTKTGITLSIQGHPDVRIYATKEVSTEKSEVGSTKFNTVTDKVYLNIVHATLGSVVVSDVNAKDLQELLNSFKTKVNKSLSKTAIGISTLKDLGFTITDTSKPVVQSSVTPGPETAVNIYAGTGDNADLSNFAIRPFSTNVETPSGKKQFTFQSVEQGFHFYKTIVANRPDIGKKIIETTNGATLKSLTNRSNLPMTPEQIKEWDSTSKSVMLNLMYDSFLENPEAAKKLLNTGNATLTHKFNGKEQDNGRFSEVITIVRDMLREGDFQQQPTQKTVARVASNFTGFQGYKGGFEGKGKRTPEGDGKDKAMRRIANSFIGEEDGVKLQSSTRTSAETINKFESNNNIENTASLKQQKVQGYVNTLNVDNYTNTINSVVMLARNGSLKNRPLREPTKEAILNAHNNGAEFIVGDMPGVDSQFIEYLQEIGAKFTVYHTGSTPRIQISESSTQVPAKTETQPTLKTLGTLIPSTPVKQGVEELFEENKELAAIGTPSQYSSYLDSVFPGSKVKEIVYHGTEDKFDKFDIKFFGKNDFGDLGKGFYFAFNKTDVFNEPIVISAIVDDTNSKKNEGYEIMIPNTEQIHILGNKSDIEGFKEYVRKETQPEEETLCQTPSLVSKNSIDIPFA